MWHLNNLENDTVIRSIFFQIKNIGFRAARRKNGVPASAHARNWAIQLNAFGHQSLQNVPGISEMFPAPDPYLKS